MIEVVFNNMEKAPQLSEKERKILKNNKSLCIILGRNEYMYKLLPNFVVLNLYTPATPGCIFRTQDRLSTVHEYRVSFASRI